MSILRERRPIAKRCIAAGLYQKLVNKLGDRFTIKQNILTPLSRQFPQGEFLHVVHQARNVFIFVASTNAAGHRQALSQQDVDNLLCFQQELLPADLLQHAYRLAPFLIIAANDKNQYAHLNKRGFCFMSKMVVSSVVSLIKNNALAKASSTIQYRLNSIFSPEILIPQELSAREMPFLDQIQNKILKQSLCPSDSTAYVDSYVSNMHLYQGVSGSGKTLVLLQRARLLQQLNPSWNLVIIAPNTAALHALQKMQRAIDPNTTIEIICFQLWCRSQIKGVLQFICADEGLELAQNIVEKHFSAEVNTDDFSAKQLLQELTYSADRAIDTLETYLAVERYDCPLSFDNTFRQRVWAAMQDMAQALRQKNLHMLCDLAPLLWYQVLADKVELPKYDAILIDDADQLAPVGFKLLQKACKSTTGQFFMMANNVQNGLLSVHKNATWREANIKVVEHETMLNRCYRSSADILQLASRLFQVENQDVAPRYQKSMKRWRWPYKKPVLFHLTTEAEELDLLVKEIMVLLDRGMKAKDILIIQAGSVPLRQMAMLLRQQLGMTVSLFGDPLQAERAIYITTLDNASAVESPVVFIIGLQSLFTTENNVISPRKFSKLYTAIMRTQHQLTFMLVTESIPQALQLKGLRVIKNPTKKNNVYPLFPV